jgi:hypothetical protein
MWSFYVESNEWKATPVSSAPIRFYHAAVGLDNNNGSSTMVVFGGGAYNAKSGIQEEQLSILSCLFVHGEGICSTALAWSNTSGRPQATLGAGIAVLRSRIMVLHGGCDIQLNVVSGQTWVYDVALNTLQQLVAPSNLPFSFRPALFPLPTSVDTVGRLGDDVNGALMLDVLNITTGIFILLPLLFLFLILLLSV